MSKEYQSEKSPIFDSQKEPKNTKKTPYNASVICFQSLPDVLQHPVDVEMGTRVKKNILKLERVYFTEYKAVNISIKHSNEDNLTM